MFLFLPLVPCTRLSSVRGRPYKTRTDQARHANNGYHQTCFFCPTRQAKHKTTGTVPSEDRCSGDPPLLKP